jgi:hypothetical protein
MYPNKTPPKPDKTPPGVDMRFIGLGAQVGCLTLIIVIVAVFAGIWLDRLLGTKPAFTLIFVLGSAPLALFLTFWTAKRSIQNLNLPPPADGKPQSKEGEKTGE